MLGMKLKLGHNYYKLVNFYTIVFFSSFIFCLLSSSISLTLYNEKFIFKESEYVVNEIIFLLVLPFFIMAGVSIYGVFKSFNKKILLRFQHYSSHVKLSFRVSDDKNSLDIYFIEMFLYLLVIAIVCKTSLLVSKEITILTLIFLASVILYKSSEIYLIIKKIYENIRYIDYPEQEKIDDFELSKFIKEEDLKDCYFVMSYQVDAIIVKDILLERVLFSCIGQFDSKRLDKDILINYMKDTNKTITDLSAEDISMVSILDY